MELKQEPHRLTINTRMPLFGILLGSICLIAALLSHTAGRVFAAGLVLFGLVFLILFTRFSRLVIDREIGIITRTTFNPGSILKRHKSIQISDITELRHGFSRGRSGAAVIFEFNNGADTLLRFHTDRPHFTGKTRLFGIKNAEQDVIAPVVAQFMNLPLVELHLNGYLPEDDPIFAKRTK